MTPVSHSFWKQKLPEFQKQQSGPTRTFQLFMADKKFSTSFGDTPSMFHQHFRIRHVGNARKIRKHLKLAEVPEGSQ